jgi:transcriptional regulator with XRE-family HTH domain
VNQTLVEVRKSLHFRSARSFYQDYLAQRTRLDFNYSYYMKIEGGKIIPSPQVISSLCSALEKDSADALMLAYCETVFPERAALFRKLKKPAKKPPLKASDHTSLGGNASAPILNQKYLTPAQIACIAKSKMHYYTFLVLTLARESVTRDKISGTLKCENINPVLADLEKLKLIHVKSDDVRSISNEMKFPNADSPEQKKLYEQIDLWNLHFYQDLGFDNLLQKMLLRRVSSRYLSVIQAHCNVLLDLVRTSDEIDNDHNDDVVMLNISIQRGSLPG